ncbi:MAG TPA: alpha/beta hydrolase [Rhizomicrobium sp.]|nr:alpha/beta hydrolase [Rhizomicrobium sp.]
MKPALEAFEPSFFVTKDGARLRAGVWRAAEGTILRGVCLVLQGQTEFLEKYCEVIDELRVRGFTVAAFDWRGQGGSVRALADTRKCHIEDFAQYDEDLRAFLDQIVAPLTSEPPLALAHSMGGHILLRTLHAAPDRIAGAVLTAPMLRVVTRGQPEWLVPIVTRVMMLLGKKADYVLGMEARDPLYMTFKDQLVTSDRVRFDRTRGLIGEHPELRLSGPTWGWLSAAYASMAKVMSPGYAQAITTPVLLYGAGKDRIVHTAAARDFVHRLPNGSYVEFEVAEHEILMENDIVRTRFWKAFDEFANRIFPIEEDVAR